jgi:nitroimidazol reductase NimA-like FMN-containing flavoprotein (pyridoxamine 5'-phosphate oxidase superfamily)
MGAPGIKDGVSEATCMDGPGADPGSVRERIRTFMKGHEVFTMLVAMEIVKIPRMEKEDYDALITEGYVSRIAFLGEKYPYIAPFLYVFDGNFMYFISTRYGKKIKYFRSNPFVSVEVERYSQDLSCYMFVTLQGRLEEVEDSIEKKKIREKFVALIKKKRLSKNILAALGHLPQEPIETIATEERSILWRLTGVTDIVALENM